MPTWHHHICPQTSETMLRTTVDIFKTKRRKRDRNFQQTVITNDFDRYLVLTSIENTTKSRVVIISWNSCRE